MCIATIELHLTQCLYIFVATFIVLNIRYNNPGTLLAIDPLASSSLENNVYSIIYLRLLLMFLLANLYLAPQSYNNHG